LLSNIWTKDNKYNIVTDWRYYKYPQDTYGLGGHTSLENADQIDYSHIRIHQAVLRNVVPNFYAGAGYFLDYHWNIEEEGLADGSVSDPQKYGLATTSMSSGPVVTLLYDNRKNSINPQGGLYANILYHPNFTFLGSDDNWQSLTIDVRKYVKFPKGSNNILAFWGFAWLTPSGKPPYLDLPSTAWDAYNNTGRGYIQGRFRGKNMLYAETEYRFNLTSNGLFGAVVFLNAESFSNYPANDIDAIWPGYGLGVRIKVNKNSNTNIGIDYGFGLGNSRGFFVNLGELF
jgi:outer membrane protein assembly factor BamA